MISLDAGSGSLRGVLSAAGAAFVLGIPVQYRFGHTIAAALAHKGPVLVDVVSARQELAMPPKTTLDQAYHFGMYMMKAVLDGRALVGVVLWGTLSGSLLPLVLRRLGFDPAKSSAPFVATLVDVTGLIIYFEVALVVLRGTLL